MSKVGEGGVCSCVRAFFVHLFNFRWLCDTSSRLDIANKLHVIHGLKASVVIVGSLSYKIVYDQYLTCWVVAAGLTLYYYFLIINYAIILCRADVSSALIYRFICNTLENSSRSDVSIAVWDLIKFLLASEKSDWMGLKAKFVHV